jgi:predicted metal-dependent phosphoesterase TrpH
VIDLHSHTTASDGQYSPDELLALAAKAGITTLAVTDHDTVSGLDACAAAAARHGIRLVCGIEVSAFIGKKEIHVLGHFVNPKEARLASFGERLKGERKSRMEQMVAKMRALGFPVTMDHVLAIAGDGHLARPHLARALVELRFCTSTKEAFDRFLKDGGPAAVPRFDVSVQDAVTLIRGAGGAATVAHPGVSKVERFELEEMAKAGLAGLEVEHSDHPPSLREKFRKWTDELGLIPTAGSDFHGEKVAPGRVFGKVSMAPELLAALEKRAGMR